MRDVAWPGLVNARDLGGLVTGQGVTRFGRVVRAEHPGWLTAEGWSQLVAYGIRTIVSLTTAGLSGVEDLRANRPVVVPGHVEGVRVVSVPIEDAADADFMDRWARTGLWGTPLYFRDALLRWPERHAAALREVAAADGGTLIHCGRGHDRTGILTFLILALAGVSAADIADDYAASADRLRSREPDAPNPAHAVKQHGRTLTGVFRDLGTIGLERHLRERGGLSAAEVTELRCLLLRPD